MFSPFRSRLAPAALGWALLIPVSAPLAATDCSSLDIEFQAAEFKNVECNSGGSRYDDASHSQEGISANNGMSFIVIQHLTAGVRTYFERGATRDMIERSGAFSKTDQWGVGPGGDGFVVAKFRGNLAGASDLPLSCFGFSRFTGHVARSTGYRHVVYGFFCSALPSDVTDEQVRHLIGAIKFNFE